MATWESFDVETSGTDRAFALQPWRVQHGEAWLTCWATDSAAEGTRATVAPASIDESRKALRKLLERWIAEDVTVVAWNALFDISWLIAYGLYDLVKQVRWMDASLLLRHLEQDPEYNVTGKKRKSYGLKDAVARFYPQYAGYDDGIDFDGNRLVLAEYNGLDAMLTRLLGQFFYSQLVFAHQGRLRAAEIEAHCLPMIAAANVWGMEIDHHARRKLHKELTAVIDDRLTQLQQHGVTEEVLNSPKQLGDLLFNQWSLPVTKTTDKGAPSTDKEALMDAAAADPRAGLVLDYREAKNNRTKFVEKLREATDYNSDGLAHPLARVFGTYSGRLTYSSQLQTKPISQIGWALHQMKRDAAYRRLVKAPPGHVIIEFDAAGQEFRWMAIQTGDGTMLQLCLPGEDPHAYMGAQIGGADYRQVQSNAGHDPECKRLRRLGKVANLSLQYRTSAKKLLSTARVSHGMREMTLQDATLIRNTYLRTYRGIELYWQRQANLIKQHLVVSTLGGRQVSVTREDVIKREWQTVSTAINFPVQGTGADQKYLAMSVLRPMLDRFESRFLFDLHDGLYFVVPEQHADAFIAMGRQVLDNLPYERAWNGYKPPIPLPWDAKVGPNWGDMEEVT